MYYGADYYPEHWPKEGQAEDARLMKEANINVVRLAEFAWLNLNLLKGIMISPGWMKQLIFWEKKVLRQ